MPDPLTITNNQDEIQKDVAMNQIVDKALKKRIKKRKPAPKQAYDKLANLVPSVSKVLNNTTYGAAAGGFTPSVKTDSGNGWTDSKVDMNRGSEKSSGWPGLRKAAFPLNLTPSLAGAGAGVGALGGAVGGGLSGAISPGEDEEGNQRSRLGQGLARALKGGLIGGVGGAALGGGVGLAGDYAKHRADQEYLKQLFAPLIESIRQNNPDAEVSIERG